MKILHLSFHKGCINDFNTVCTLLNNDFDFKVRVKVEVLSSFKDYCTNQNLPPLREDNGGHYAITHDLANKYWNRYKEYFNEFDLVVTSDTAILSRIFLQNQWKKPLLIWVCNRFDYFPSGKPDPEFYQLFQMATTKHNVKVFGYTEFENIYCKMHNILLENVIQPLGGIGNTKNKDSELNERIYVPPYHNDTKLIDLPQILHELGFSVATGKYNGPQELSQYKAVVHIPYAWSNFAFFEMLQYNIVYFIPSMSFFDQLSNSMPSKFFFSPPYLRKYLDQSEWYKHSNLVIYFDSWTDLSDKIKNLNYDNHKEKLKKYAIYHTNNTLEKWKELLLYMNSDDTRTQQYLDYLSKALSYYVPDQKFIKYFNRVPKSRDYTFKYCLEHLKKKPQNLILELGTSRSFTDGRFPGCNSNDPKYWEINHPEKWDWSAGCFTRFFAECSSSENTILTVDLEPSHIERCKIMTSEFDNIGYAVSSSEEFLESMPPKSVDLLYLDTGDMTPIEFTAQLHLREAKLVVERDILADQGLILIDDVRSCVPKEAGESSDYGKAKYSIPYFLEHGYHILVDEYQVVLQK